MCIHGLLKSFPPTYTLDFGSHQLTLSFNLHSIPQCKPLSPFTSICLLLAYRPFLAGLICALGTVAGPLPARASLYLCHMPGLI